MEQKRRLLDRTIPSIIVLFLLALVVSVVVEIPRYVLGIDEVPYRLVEVPLLVVVMELVFSKLILGRSYEGSIKLAGTQRGLMMFAPVIILDVVFFVLDRILGNGTTMNSLLYVLSLSLFAGVSEELMFRAYAVPNFMRADRTYRGMVVGVIATSVLFGLTHLSNIGDGANVARTLSQVVTAGISGSLFAAVFINAGSILPCMIMHFLHDFINLLFMAVTECGGIAEGFSLVGAIAQAVFSGTELALAVWLLRPARFDEIRALWDKKWHL